MGAGWEFLCCAVLRAKGANFMRLLNDCLMCWRCLRGHGVWLRATTMGVKQRALHRVPKLRAMLETPVSLRLKPHLWGTMERRKRLEAALARCEFIVSQGRRYRDVRVEEIPPEPIARPKVNRNNQHPRRITKIFGNTSK